MPSARPCAPRSRATSNRSDGGPRGCANAASGRPGRPWPTRRQGLCGAAWLFGSYAWGKPTAGSDLDLLVEGCADPDWLAALVARTTGTEVHVVCAETAPASLRDRALAHGTKL